MADGPEAPGVDAFVRGVQLTVAVALVVLFLRYGEGFAEGYAFLAAVGDRDAATTITGIAVVVLVITVLLLAVPVYASLHTADVAIAGPVGAVGVGPGLLGLPDLIVLIPPAVLVWAGYRAAGRAGDPTTQARLKAGASVVFGYGVVTVLALVPSAWLFEAVVNDVVLSEVPASAGSVRMVIRNPLQAHLVVGVVYPAVFGAAGGALAGLIR